MKKLSIFNEISDCDLNSNPMSFELYDNNFFLIFIFILMNVKVNLKNFKENVESYTNDRHYDSFKNNQELLLFENFVQILKSKKGVQKR